MANKKQVARAAAAAAQKAAQVKTDKRNMIIGIIAVLLVAGVALSFTRSLGEFGAVIFIAGNIAWKTEVTSLMIFVRLQEFDYPAASAIASVILAASLLLLFSINTLQSRFGRRVVGH